MEIFWSQKLKVPNEEKVREFFQKLSNRIQQGHCRYGAPDRRKKYLTRLKMELKAYQQTGNYEHLLNLCVYGWLESMEPENKKFCFDPTVGSVTRGKV